MSLVTYARTTRGSCAVCQWPTTMEIESASYTLFMTEYVTGRLIPVTGYIDVSIDLEQYSKKVLEVIINSDENKTAFHETCDYRVEVTAKTSMGNFVFLAFIAVE